MAINIIDKILTRKLIGRIIIIETIETINKYPRLEKKFAGIIGIKKINDVSDIYNQLVNAGEYIGTDSGPAHLASALGVPKIRIIYGPNLPVYSKPDNSIIQIIESKYILSCRPCQDRRCVNDTYQKCYSAIDLDAFI